MFYTYNDSGTKFILVRLSFYFHQLSVAIAVLLFKQVHIQIKLSNHKTWPFCRDFDNKSYVILSFLDKLGIHRGSLTSISPHSSQVDFLGHLLRCMLLTLPLSLSESPIHHYCNHLRNLPLMRYYLSEYYQ